MLYTWELYLITFKGNRSGDYYLAAPSFLDAAKQVSENIKSDDLFIGNFEYIGEVEFRIEDGDKKDE